MLKDNLHVENTTCSIVIFEFCLAKGRGEGLTVHSHWSTPTPRSKLKPVTMVDHISTAQIYGTHVCPVRMYSVGLAVGQYERTIMCSGGSRGWEGCIPLPLSIFFHFHAFSAKTMPNNRLAPALWDRCPTSGKSWIRHWVGRGGCCFGNQRRHCRRQCYATCSLRCAVYLTSQDRLWAVNVAGGVVGGSRLGELLCLESGIDEFDSREQCLNAGCFWENVTSVCCCSEYLVCTVVWNWEIEGCLQTERRRKRKRKNSLIYCHRE